jgi:hypothetical protein
VIQTVNKKEIAMSRRTIGYALLLAAFASSIVTTTVLAQGKRSKKKKNAQFTVRATQSNVVTRAGSGKPSVPVFPATGRTMVESVTVTRVSNGFHVIGQASVRDARPTANFMWAVRVRNPKTKSIVAETRYDTQLFQALQDGTELRPTFEDVVTPDLQPGTYKVELVLYEVPPGGVDKLTPAVMEHQLMAKNTATVTINP